MTPRDWDAATYERLSAPMTAMGSEVLDRLVLRGDETVLDAGCGTGNVTRVLHERLPRGRVIAVDAAPSMVEQARALLPADVEVRQADLLELTLDEPVDAVLSTATFHWIGDHERLFANLHAALAPGGRLVAQCGGHGNVEEVKQAGLDVAARAALRRALRRLGGRLDVRHARGDRAAPARRRLHATSGAGSRASTSIPATRPPTCARSASARSSPACPRSCASRSSPRRSSACRTRSRSTTCA